MTPLHDIGGFSFSHQNTTLEQRDALAFSSQEIAQTIPLLREHCQGGEVAILSTCNRTEVYAYAPQASQLWAHLKPVVVKLKPKLATFPLPQPLTLHSGAAARHLFRVASSLESVAIGEDQILAQVKDAHDLVLRSTQKSPVLGQLFQFAIRAGKQVRTDTFLCQGNVSISSVSVDLAKKIFGGFNQTTVLLVGAGETNVNAATHFRSAGATRFIVVNRSEERGRAAAARFGGDYMPMHKLSDACIKADIAVFATGSPHFLLDGESIQNVMKARRGRQLFLLDISNPRNVDPLVGDHSGVYLFNIDHLDAIVKENLRGRIDEIPKAQALIDQYLLEWDAWLRSLRVAPTIGAMSKHFYALRQKELDHYQYKVDPQTYELLEEFSKRLLRKIQHNPIAFLRQSVEDNSLRSEDINLILDLHGLRETEDSD